MISIQQYTILKLITNVIGDPLLQLETQLQSKGLNSIERRAVDAKLESVVITHKQAISFVVYLWSHSPTSYSTLFTYVADNYIKPTEESFSDYIKFTTLLFGTAMNPNLERINNVFGEIYNLGKR